MEKLKNWTVSKISWRTIDSILEYHLLEWEKKHLRNARIINGIGGEWKNIEKIFLANIEMLPWFDKNKAEYLLEDIRAIAYEHDIQFRFRLGFYWSNFKFAKKLFHLLHWSPVRRFSIALIAFILLNRHGKEFYINN